MTGARSKRKEDESKDRFCDFCGEALGKRICCVRPSEKVLLETVSADGLS